MAEKIIGLIMSGFEKEPLLSVYRGIVDSAKSLGYSTQALMVFLSSQATDSFNLGELHIYETIDYSRYDGIIVAMNTIHNEKTQEYLMGKLEKLEIPVVALDCTIPGAISILSDNYGATRALVNHFVKVHGRKKINYISGIEGNSEAEERLRGYLDEMEAQGLDSEGRVYPGTFYVKDGKGAFEHFQRENIDYDAMVCANDMSAFSVLCELRDRGIKVHEEVAVAGFDNMLEAGTRNFNLTSAWKKDAELGHRAVEILSNYFRGEKVEKVYKHPCEIIYRGSCGCYSDINFVDKRSNRYFTDFASKRLLKEYIKTMIEKGLGCNSFGEFIDIMKDFIKSIDPPFFSMSILADYQDVFELDELVPSGEYNVINSTSSYNVIFYADGKFVSHQAKNMGLDGDDFLKLVSDSEVWRKAMHVMPTSQFINSPLHFNNKDIGQIVWGNSDFPLITDVYWEFISSVDMILYAIYNNILLQNLYRRDALTRLYNRYGLSYYWEKFIRKSAQTKSDITIIFADINNLKKINDSLGHEYGDKAIMVVAKALRNQESPTVKAIRYGGDELLLLCLGKAENEIKSIISNVEKAISIDGMIFGASMSVSASIGAYSRPYDSDLSLEKCLKKADEAMYLEKAAYRKN